MRPLPPPRSFFSIARSSDIPSITSPSPLSPAVHDRVQAILLYLTLFLKISMLVLSVLGTAMLLSMHLFMDWPGDRPQATMATPWCIPNATVSLDGRDDFSSITSAVEAAPSFSRSRYCIHVRRGRYVERVTIPIDKTNIAIIGDGVDQTRIAPTWSRLPSATLLVQGLGFTAVDLTVENPEAMAYAAVENWSDGSVFFRCKLTSLYEVLIPHFSRQFYRECQFIGSRTLIYGDGRAYFQRCSITIDTSFVDVQHVVAMRSTDFDFPGDGFVFHRCSVSAMRDQLPLTPLLGGAFGTYGRIIYMECSIDVRAGWLGSGSASRIIVFGEYGNVGVGAAYSTHFPGVHTLDSRHASLFSLREFFSEDWVPVDIRHELDV